MAAASTTPNTDKLKALLSFLAPNHPDQEKLIEELTAHAPKAEAAEIEAKATQFLGGEVGSLLQKIKNTYTLEEAKAKGLFTTNGDKAAINKHWDDISKLAVDLLKSVGFHKDVSQSSELGQYYTNAGLPMASEVERMIQEIDSKGVFLSRFVAPSMENATLIHTDAVNRIYNATTHGATHHDLATHKTQLLDSLKQAVAETHGKIIDKLPDAAKAHFEVADVEKIFTDLHTQHVGGLDAIYKGIDPTKVFVEQSDATHFGNLITGAVEAQVVSHYKGLVDDATQMIDAAKLTKPTITLEIGRAHEQALETLKSAQFEAETAKTAGTTIFNNIGKSLHEVMKQAGRAAEPLGHTGKTQIIVGAAGVAVAAAGAMLGKRTVKGVDGLPAMDENGQEQKKLGFAGKAAITVGVALVGTAIAAKLGWSKATNVMDKVAGMGSVMR